MIVSVVAPTHQRPELLKRLLESLEKQSLEKANFEVIIVPTPNDPGIEVLNSFKLKSDLQLRIEIPENDPWSGKNVSFKRNYGAECAKSSWVAFIDDDCVASTDWLKSATLFFNDPKVGGIEGKTITPQNCKKTLTWKGMQRLANFGGYQTCNIFYRKELFLKVGGFDQIGFPWYLEDSDLAWSILDTGHKIESSEDSVVTHPVGEPAPWRLIHEAKGMGLKVLLFKKHPEIYQANQTKALRKYHYVYLLLQIGILQSLLIGSTTQFLISKIAFLTVVALHMYKIFGKVETSVREIFDVTWRMIVAPPIALYSTIVALFKNRCSMKEALYILSPF